MSDPTALGRSEPVAAQDRPDRGRGSNLLLPDQARSYERVSCA
jgi:hypothetical protein